MPATPLRMRGRILPLVVVGLVVLVAVPCAFVPGLADARRAETQGPKAPLLTDSRTSSMSGAWRVLPGAVAGNDGPASNTSWMAMGLAAVGVMACTAAHRAAQQKKRAEAVVRYAHPTMLGKPRWKMVRRTKPYGGVPSLTRHLPSQDQMVKIKPWRTRKTPELGIHGRARMEKQRIKFHYNINEKTMVNYMKMAWVRGESQPVTRVMQILESRLDNFIWRAGIQPTMAAARNYVNNCNVLIKSADEDRFRLVNIASIRLKPGDQVSIRKHKNSMSLAQANMDREGNIEVPRNIDFDRNKKIGTYLDVCDPEEFGTYVNEEQILWWYSGQGKYGQNSIRRTHKRFFPGTDIEIKKNKHHGYPRPTEENVYNMRKGLGLRKRGRARPPSLWGRKLPNYNSPIDPYKGDYGRYKNVWA